MRRRTVRTGLHLIITAVVLIILAAFSHGRIALLLALSPASETRFIFLSLLWGGIFGFCGIAVAIFGLLLSPGGGTPRVGLVTPVVILALLLLMFAFLLFSSINTPDYPGLRPGETITI